MSMASSQSASDIYAPGAPINNNSTNIWVIVAVCVALLIGVWLWKKK
jgi:hypothetical protein